MARYGRKKFEPVGAVQSPRMADLTVGDIAFHLTKDLKRVYSGHGSILVQLGEEHTYNPVGQSAAGNGLTTTIDTITLTEAGSGRNRTNSPAQNRFDKDAFTKINQAPTERARQDAIMELRRSVEESYSVMPQAKSNIINVAFKHGDPDIAVATTNAFIDAYVQFTDGRPRKSSWIKMRELSQVFCVKMILAILSLNKRAFVNVPKI